MNTPKRLAVLAAFSGQGGVERMVLNLLEGFAAYDIDVDLLPIVRKHYPLPRIANPRARILPFAARHSSLVAPELAGYLGRERPDVLLAVRDRGIRAAVMARRLAGVDVPVVGNLHSLLGPALAEKGWLQRWWRLWPMGWIYGRVDRLIAVSDGVADDIAAIARFPRENIRVVRNPVVDEPMLAAAREPVEHPWLNDGELPVVMGAGRLSAEKDFATLIRAFAGLNRIRPCRLIILGEGKQRPALTQLVADLGLLDVVDLPGYTPNPYAWLARASLFALSSVREGSGNVLTEAMALGVPVVSTDCPTGPREMLRDGRYGQLVPVGDDGRLATAMAETLTQPIEADVLRAAVGDYRVERSARGYLAALGLLPAGMRPEPLPAAE